MKARLATLIERDGKLTGALGGAIIIVERDGTAKGGEARWRLVVAEGRTAEPGRERQADNRRGASWRIERRKAEGIVSVGGDD